VLQIRGIFGTDPYLTPDPAPDPAKFVSDLHDGNQKVFFSQVFLLISLEATFTSFKDEKL
jgi:hypothetical protein